MDGDFAQAREHISEAISQWRRSNRPDAKGFLDSHPELKSSHSLVIDLVYEEFCLRVEAGEHVDTEKFCGRFPTIQHSLQRLISVHRQLGSNVDLIADIEWPEANTRWLDWDLVEPLGRGAFSRVFLAREHALGNREVVLKCSFAGPHEAFILGSLSHPNIVPVHSSRLDGESGLAGISMPLLGKATLAHVLDCLAADDPVARSPQIFQVIARGAGPSQASSVPTSRAVYEIAVARLIEQVARGLDAAHQADVIHGDIKPSNVLLSFSGQPMLMDFNLSGGPDKNSIRMGGTPPYMAPECADAFLPKQSRDPEALVLDRRSDIFSLGVVFLELLLGRIPLAFDFRSANSLPGERDWQKLVRGAQPKGRAIDAGLQRILSRCLAWDPARRYATARELVNDLEAFLNSKQNARRLTRRLAIAASAGVVLASSATIAIASLPSERESALLQARQEIRAGKYLKAAHTLRDMTRLPSDDWLDAWIGYCLAQAGSYSVAKDYLQLAAADYPRSAALKNDLGYCAEKLAANAEAEDYFSAALRIDPGLQAAWHNRALLRLEQATGSTPPKNVSAACWRDFQKALAAGPANAQLHYDMAFALAWARRRGQHLDGDLEYHVRQSLAAGRSRRDFIGFPFSDVGLPLSDLERDAKLIASGHQPLEAQLLLPPPMLLPEG